MIKLDKLVFNSFQVNTYLIYDEKGTCIIVDPAAYTEDEKSKLDTYISSHNLSPQMAVFTHCHIDHILALHHVQTTYNTPIALHKEELKNLKNGPLMGDLFGFTTEPFGEPDKFIADNEIIQLGEYEIKALHVPGHSTGSLSYYSQDGNFAITGDALFSGSIGRTDLPGGDYDTLIASIRNKLFSLSPETKIFPGHGPESSIGNEIQNNPFFNA